MLTQFDFLRISLSQINDDKLFVRTSPDGTRFNREAWIRDYFSEPRKIPHWGNVLSYFPSDLQSSTSLIIGRIVKPKSIKELTPPEEGLVPTIHRSWRGSIVIIDPAHHDDGQKIAIESNQDVGKTASIGRSIASSMNAQSENEPFHVEVFPIATESSFYDFAANHDNRIKRITFRVAVPNMFGGPEDYEEDMKRLRDQAGVSKLTTRLDSAESLNINSPPIKNVVEYTEKGAGEVSAIAVDGNKYNSREYTKNVKVEIDEADVWESVIRALDRIFP